MTRKFSSVVFWASQVPVQDAVISTTRAEESVVPCYCTNAAIVATHRLDQSILGRVPDLQLTCVGAHGEVLSVTGPLDTGYSIIRSNVAQFGDFAVLS